MIFRPFTELKPAMASMDATGFKEAHLPERHLKESNWNLYRVYKNREEFVEVEGEAVYDALAKSGVTRPFKIIRAMKELGSVLTPTFLAEDTEPHETAPKSEIPQNGVIDPPAAGASTTPDA